jgi:uncharacterized membrane protein
MLEELFKRIAAMIALGVEGGAVLVIAIGATEALVRVLQRFVSAPNAVVSRKSIWVRFAVWLLLGLEFELAADVIRSAIAPTWAGIGQLAAIAAIRTFLNYFLERDIEEYEHVHAQG